jgi:hypothetical protein
MSLESTANQRQKNTQTVDGPGESAGAAAAQLGIVPSSPIESANRSITAGSRMTKADKHVA